MHHLYSILGEEMDRVELYAFLQSWAPVILLGDGVILVRGRNMVTSQGVRPCMGFPLKGSASYQPWTKFFHRKFVVV